MAEIIAGGIARALGLDVPEIVLAELDPDLARTEPDPEIQELIRASGGTNVALDFLPGSANFDPVADPVDAALASRIVWHDAFTSNVDRSARNTNLLAWHRRLWLIDHGAALYFHHGWDGEPDAADKAFPMVRDHVLLPFASRLVEADAALAPRLDAGTIAGIVADVPDALLPDATIGDAQTQRRAYVEYFCRRLARRHFVQEAIDARG
ncbi:HipA family kinase [Arenimonas daejeonensis]|uniref:HipA family kinase n=1 Tax=Arenimonas daejeonensis TaxID=370777 RepID=UPI001D15B553|nr:HipA family kinase [Arenimonas daejeonensis]